MADEKPTRSVVDALIDCVPPDDMAVRAGVSLAELAKCLARVEHVRPVRNVLYLRVAHRALLLEQLKTNALTKLAEIALTPGGEGIGACRVRETQRKACVDILRSIDELVPRPRTVGPSSRSKQPHQSMSMFADGLPGAAATRPAPTYYGTPAAASGATSAAGDDTFPSTSNESENRPATSGDDTFPFASNESENGPATAGDDTFPSASNESENRPARPGDDASPFASNESRRPFAPDVESPVDPFETMHDPPEDAAARRDAYVEELEALLADSDQSIGNLLEFIGSIDDPDRKGPLGPCPDPWKRSSRAKAPAESSRPPPQT